MPELPEVESLRRELAAELEGARIRGFRAARRSLRFQLPAGFQPAKLEGLRLLRIGRRAKYLVFETDGPGLLCHLGMSGRLDLSPEARAAEAKALLARRERHEHLVFLLARHQRLWRLGFVDPRRFGFWDELAPGEAAAVLDRAAERETGARGARGAGKAASRAAGRLARLGPEPLGPAFDGTALAQHFEGKRRSVKEALLDQTVVAGIGSPGSGTSMRARRSSTPGSRQSGQRGA